MTDNNIQLDPKLDAHFQSALLYTTTSGQRRVRCSNIVASVTENARESLRFVDQDAVVTIIAKESASKVGERSLKEIRSALQEKTTDILAGYRKHFADSHAPGQLVLPENLKEFSMYILGLVKSRALKGGKEPSDRRVHEARLIKGMGPSELSLYLYPRMIAIHNLEPGEGFADENGHLKMPEGVRVSFSQIEEGGAYLVDNGQILILWLHELVSPNLLEDLFGEGFDNLQKLDPNMSTLPVLETHLNAQVRNILLHMESQRGSKGMAIQLARQRLDGAEFEFARLLYEDRNGESLSYVDWLVMLHRAVGMDVSPINLLYTRWISADRKFSSSPANAAKPAKTWLIPSPTPSPASPAACRIGDRARCIPGRIRIGQLPPDQTPSLLYHSSA